MQEPSESVVVRRNDERSRYEIVVDDHVVGIADFESDGNLLVFPHTEIASDRRGNGLGERLVQDALDDVRARGERVRPQCWFVREFIDLHQEYADLVG
jgi:predicted GNAT family acetyltransferase